MARQLPAGNDALTENLLRSDTQITCRYKAGTTDNAAKSIPFGLMQTSPIAVCSSGADSVSKVATVSNYPDFTLDNGKEVVVYFAEGNTAANPSMNVNGTGAIPLDSGYWNAGSFVKLKYVDITVSGTRIQKYLVDAGAYNTTTQLNGALANYSRATMTDYNLNNYLTEGNFCCVGNDNNYTNCPSGYNANFSFEVKRVMSNDDKYVIQFFRPYGESREFIRSNYYAGDRGILWTDWKPSDFLKEKVVNIGDVTVSGSNYALLYSEEGIKIVSIQLQYWSDNTGAFSINAYLDNRVYLLASNGFSIKNLQLKLFYV